MYISSGDSFVLYLVIETLFYFLQLFDIPIVGIGLECGSPKNTISLNAEDRKITSSQ